MQIFYSNSPIGEEKQTAKKLLAYALKQNGYNIEDYIISKTEHGKPYIKKFPLDFNISHTRGFVACVLGKDVGIDAQNIKRVSPAVIKRVCSEAEIIKIENAQKPDEQFIRFWTFKEAYTKMIGSGFRYSFKNVNIENALELHPNIKFYQKKIGDIILTVVERDNFCGTISLEHKELDF